jgi:hypothetical protein
MRITRERVFREAVKEDFGVTSLIRKAATIDEAIQLVNKDFDLYKKERKQLVDTMAFFTVFQNINSITGRGDPFRDCLLDHLQMEQYKRENAGAKNENLIYQLQLVLQNYDATTEKLRAQDPSEAKETMQMTAENVLKYENILYGLQIHGPKLRDLRHAIQQSRGKDIVASSEKIVDLGGVSGGGRGTKILEPVDTYFSKK